MKKTTNNAAQAAQAAQAQAQAAQAQAQAAQAAQADVITAAQAAAFKSKIAEIESNVGKAVPVESYSQQRKTIDSELSVISDFSAFCEYGKSVNWSFTVNRQLLCGKKDGTVTGVGMTDAEYTKLSAKLTALSALLIDYISVDMVIKSGSHNAAKLKELNKLLTEKEDYCFTVLKAIKKVFNIESKCSKWDISTLAYMTITVKYRDRTNIKAGYTFGQCGTMTLLNKVLRLESCVNAIGERMKALRKAKSTKSAEKEFMNVLAEEVAKFDVQQIPEKK